MIEIKLDSEQEFILAHKALNDVEKEASKKNYKPKMMTIGEWSDLKSRRQVNAIHSIIQELYVSGYHSSDAKSFEELKIYIKTDVIGLLEIKGIYNLNTKAFEKRTRAKSMRDYTKKEMTQAIENVLAYVKNCACNTRKMEEIINGMEKL